MSGLKHLPLVAALLNADRERVPLGLLLAVGPLLGVQEGADRARAEGDHLQLALGVLGGDVHALGEIVAANGLEVLVEIDLHVLLLEDHESTRKLRRAGYQSAD
jgi:hypothetical protein